MTAGKGVLEIQVSGDNRGQNQDEGGRDLETKPQPVQKARPTLGSDQSYTEQKNKTTLNKVILALARDF